MASIRKKQKFTTDVPCEVKEMVWEIKNFQALILSDKKLKSAALEFDAGDTMGLPTHWKFYFVRNEHNGDVGIFLKLLQSPDKYDTVVASFDYKLPHEDDQFDDDIYIEDLKEFPCSGTRSAFKFAKEPDSASLAYLVDGHLTIRLKFKLYNKVKATSEEIGPLKTFDESARLDFIQDFQKLFESGVNTDITIKTKDAKELKAHKLILTSRSPVFFAMFQNAMTESASGIVAIEDVSSEAMNIILKFIYTGKVDEKWEENIEEIIYAADKYSLSFLKDYCDRALARTCTVNNVWNLLKLAKLYGLSQAEKEISEYIKTNIGGILLANNPV